MEKRKSKKATFGQTLHVITYNTNHHSTKSEHKLIQKSKKKIALYECTWKVLQIRTINEFNSYKISSQSEPPPTFLPLTSFSTSTFLRDRSGETSWGYKETIIGYPSISHYIQAINASENVVRKATIRFVNRREELKFLFPRGNHTKDWIICVKWSEGSKVLIHWHDEKHRKQQVETVGWDWIFKEKVLEIFKEESPWSIWIGTMIVTSVIKIVWLPGEGREG